MRAELLGVANEVLSEYQQWLVSQGVPREVAYGRGPALEVLATRPFSLQLSDTRQRRLGRTPSVLDVATDTFECRRLLDVG